MANIKNEIAENDRAPLADKEIDEDVQLTLEDIKQMHKDAGADVSMLDDLDESESGGGMPSSALADDLTNDLQLDDEELDALDLEDLDLDDESLLLDEDIELDSLDDALNTPQAALAEPAAPPLPEPEFLEDDLELELELDEAELELEADPVAPMVAAPQGEPEPMLDLDEELEQPQLLDDLQLPEDELELDLEEPQLLDEEGEIELDLEEPQLLDEEPQLEAELLDDEELLLDQEMEPLEAMPSRQYAAREPYSDQPMQVNELRQQLLVTHGNAQLDLSQHENIAQISENAQMLLSQSIDQAMKRMNKVWSAESQIADLYQQLESFSKQRAAVDKIINSAQQIAMAQEMVDSERVKQDEAHDLLGRIEELKTVLERYEAVFSQLSQ